MIVITNSHAESSEGGRLQCAYVFLGVHGSVTSAGIDLETTLETTAGVRSLCRPPCGVRLRDDNFNYYCFLRGIATGGIGRRIGTIAPRDGSAFMFARDITSC